MDLSQISTISISRFISLISVNHIELIGFADASQQAYGACLYIRATNNDNTIVNLLTSKSKVAPLKMTTIPKLELCAALLLSKLARCVSKVLNIPASNIHLFSDSKVILAWLRSEPYKRKLFVANRVSAIQQAVAGVNWRYVSTKDNPADLISRGMSPIVIKSSTLWWNAPSWLRQPMYNWPSYSIDRECNIKAKQCLVIIAHPLEDNIFKF